MVVQDFCTVMHMPEVVKDKQLKKKCFSIICIKQVKENK